MDAHGRAAVDAAALQTIGYPFSWVALLSEVIRVQRALANPNPNHNPTEE